MNYLIHFTRVFPDADCGPKELASAAILLTRTDIETVTRIIKGVFKKRPETKGAMIYKQEIGSKELGICKFILDTYAENKDYDGTTASITTELLAEKEFIAKSRKEVSDDNML